MPPGRRAPTRDRNQPAPPDVREGVNCCPAAYGLRNRPPGGRQPFRFISLLAILLLPGLPLTACGTTPAPGAASPVAGGRRTSRSAPPGPASVFGRALLSPRVAVTRTGLYVTWQVSAPGSVVRSELARVDPVTGRAEAQRRIGAAVGGVLQAAGSLWAVTVAGEAPQTDVLLRLSPGTLTVVGRWRIGTGSVPRSQVLVIAGGGLWAAGGNRLLRLSLPGGKVTASIALPGAAASDLSANAAGSVLVVGEAGSGGRGAVQRRNPVTGAILASHPVAGVTAPGVAGPVGSAVWVSEAGGMMGYVQRLDTTTLAPGGSTCTPGGTSSTCVLGTNGITARMADGLLWVTQPGGGNSRNYCARPVSGRELAPIGLPQPSADAVLAVTPHRVFYAAPGPRGSQYLRHEAVPRACRAR